MGNNRPNNIYVESFPLFFVTGLIGIRPFRICNTAIFGYLYVALFLAAYCAICWYAIFDTIDLFEKMKLYSPIAKLRLIQAFTNFVLVVFTIISAAAQSTKIRQLDAELNDVDEKLKMLNVRFDYGKAMRRDLVHLVEIIMYTILFNLLEYFPLVGPETTRFFDILWLVNSFPQFVNTIAIASFVIIIRKIRRRLEVMNEIIPNVMIANKNVIGSLEIEMNNVFRLRLLNKIHEKLVDVATILNETYGLLLLTSFVVYFLTACVHSRTFYLIVSNMSQSVDTAVEFLWVIFYLCKYLYVVSACHNVMVQVKQSGQLLRDKWTDADHHPLKQEADAMARRVESRSLQLTACNFFVIDYPTLKKIIVALAVYIFLVANFSDVSVATQNKQM